MAKVFNLILQFISPPKEAGVRSPDTYYFSPTFSRVDVSNL